MIQNTHIQLDCLNQFLDYMEIKNPNISQSINSINKTDENKVHDSINGNKNVVTKGDKNEFIIDILNLLFI